MQGSYSLNLDRPLWFLHNGFVDRPHGGYLTEQMSSRLRPTVALTRNTLVVSVEKSRR